METPRIAKFSLGQVVRHRIFPFRGVIFDVDPQFSHTEQWWLSIPLEARPDKDQPFYRLLAETEQSCHVAYVSEQNLVADHRGAPGGHPDADQMFVAFEDGGYRLRPRATH